jgi:hypothetical protein
MAGALARERLMDVHFRYVIELVDHASDEVDAARALSIYKRLHGLQGLDASALSHKVFVALGRRAPQTEVEEKPEEGLVESPQSILGVIRRRLRGRVNTELREWVEYHTGRAETELLWVHVENALQYVDLLDSVLSMGEAVALYADELGVPAARTETVYYLALAHRSASAVLTVPGDDSARSSTVFPEPTRQSLRIVGSRRAARRKAV